MARCESLGESKLYTQGSLLHPALSSSSCSPSEGCDKIGSQYLAAQRDHRSAAGPARHPSDRKRAAAATATETHDYGLGAFVLAASQIYLMVK